MNTELLDDDIEKNFDFMRQDNGGMVTSHNGIADKLLRNDRLYNELKGDWQRTALNASGNIVTTTGREDGKFFIRREQINDRAIMEHCKAYRAAAEAGIPDPLAPPSTDGKPSYKWMELPRVVSIRISDDYFGGMPWDAIKHDKTLKAQFYKVVEREYPHYVCYPNGKLPIPIDVPYPTKRGQQRFFQGM